MPHKSCLTLLLLISAAHAAPKPLWPVPAEIASSHYTVTINGVPTPVMHAALNLYFLNFPAAHKIHITVTADRDDFWAAGVEVEPWRLNIRPTRSGRTIAFTLDGPAQITISRPNDFLSQADMLFLFANPPEQRPPSASTANLRYIAPGAHHENLDPHTGDSIYLAPGAVLFGSLNLWQVSNVHVFGRGIIVYDGPQNPADDDGWMHKPNWHCIVMDQARDISIEGITCVVRSRTWQIQMKDSRHIRFDNIKVIGANAGNANADGMDWLGGGDTLVTHSFFRAADDVFSMQTSWEGYGPAAFALQGQPVTNVTVEDSVLSTSISNIVRAAWPEKNFEGGSFTLRNSDVLHVGLGGCGIPFALMELWADPNGRGSSSGYEFSDIRIDHPYSLLQLRQSTGAGTVSNTVLRDIASLEIPSLVPSTLKGPISNTTIDNVTLASTPARTGSAVPLQTLDSAEPPHYPSTVATVHITRSAALVAPQQKVRFEAVPDSASTAPLRFDWFFGDGTHAAGPHPSHRFPDTAGTLLDGSGRFRVLLHVTGPAGRSTWLYEPVVVTTHLLPALPQTPTAGLLDIPVDAGYTFALLARDPATLSIDDQPLAASPAPFAQVCGLAGNAVQAVTASIGLARGPHRVTVTSTGSTEDLRVLYWRPNHPPVDIAVSLSAPQ